MKYAQIRNMDVSNGKGVGVSIFVQGCPHHCFNCFNQETWDRNGGMEFTKEIEDKFIELVERPYITRVSFLGGEPLAPYNLEMIQRIIAQISDEKKIWLYTGYTLEELSEEQKEVVSLCDIVIDGRFIDELKDFRLKFRGSSNQRIWQKREDGIWEVIS